MQYMAVGYSLFYYVLLIICTQKNNDPTRFIDNKIRIKISMDGAKYSRAANFCIFSFTVLDGDEFNQASMYANITDNSDVYITGYRCSCSRCDESKRGI